MRSFIIILTMAIIISLCITTWADEPKIEVEYVVDQSGSLLTRFITPGNPGELVKKEQFNQGSGLDQEVIWTTEDPAAIARHVDISGNGVNVIAGWWLNYERVENFLTQGSGVPLWSYSITPSFFMPVSASDDGNTIAATGMQIPLSVWLDGAGPAPSWQYTYPAGFIGKFCDVSDNGEYVVALCQVDGGTDGKLIVFERSTTTPIWIADFDGNTQINGVEISEDNNWILIGTYNYIYIYDFSAQNLYCTLSNYGQTMAAFSGNGEYLATGDFNGQLKLFRNIGGTYVFQWTNIMGGWVTAVDVSSDGSTVMGGNFVYSPSYGGMVRGFDINGTLFWTYDQYGDYIDNVALCNDGSVGIATSWGALDYTYGDVFTAFTMNTGEVIFRLLDDIDEPGSLHGCAISDDGAYACAGGKAVHARTFGNGGEVYSFLLGIGGPFDVDITMTPSTTPIIIPPEGGDFDFTVDITNNEADPVTFDAWIMAQLPSGGWYGPIVNRTLTLGAGTTATRDMTQSVPGVAPAGTYNYTGRVGGYPDNICI